MEEPIRKRTAAQGRSFALTQAFSRAYVIYYRNVLLTRFANVNARFDVFSTTSFVHIYWRRLIDLSITAHDETRVDGLPLGNQSI